MAQELHSATDVQPFHQLLTGAQSSLYAFICSLLGGASNSRDVLQETNLVLWEKADQFDRSREFLPWAFQFAHLQVLAFRRKQTRDRLIFDDELVADLAAQFTDRVKSVDARLEALNECLGKLPAPERQLVRRYYERGGAVESISNALGITANTVAARLYRIRKTLSACVQRTLQLESR
jgi:RNA polymerase sigma-70 factor (ECF subfamily)